MNCKIKISYEKKYKYRYVILNQNKIVPKNKIIDLPASGELILQEYSMMLSKFWVLYSFLFFLSVLALTFSKKDLDNENPTKLKTIKIQYSNLSKEINIMCNRENVSLNGVDSFQILDDNYTFYSLISKRLKFTKIFCSIFVSLILVILISIILIVAL